MSLPPGPRPIGPDQMKTSCRVLGSRQIAMFRAMCAAAGRRPHELVADLVLDAIRAAWDDPDLAHVAEYNLRNARRRAGSHLTVVGRAAR